jgi:glucose uptake protein
MGTDAANSRRDGQVFCCGSGRDRCRSYWFCAGGGVLFNVANLLLVAAIEIAGLAVAFPVGIGLALIIGAVSSYMLSPHGNPLMLFGGITLVVAAIVCDAIAYRLRESEHQATSRRGVVISLIAGLLMGTFYPFVSRAP